MALTTAIRGRTLAPLLLVLATPGCEQGRPDSVGPAVVVTTDTTPEQLGTVRISGLGPGGARRAGRSGSGIATITVSVDSTGPAPPPLAGSWKVDRDELTFSPRFRPDPGLIVTVTIDTAALAGRTGAPAVFRQPLPAAAINARSTRLLGIHPAIDTVPANLLRFYLEFSAPMMPGHALTSVRLLDPTGAEVAGAFLDVSEELWDPSGRRLTMLFDPGRVKQGIRTNLESGRPLRAGGTYRLAVSSAWLDRRGSPLQHEVSRTLVVTEADHSGPDPARWQVVAPRAAGDPLEVQFDEPLDHALVATQLAVTTSTGAPVAGSVTVTDGDRRWQFSPASPWTVGRYRLVVSPELEDLAGNRPGRPFDLEVGSRIAQPILERTFEVR